MPPKTLHQVLVSASDIFVDIAAKRFGCISNGTNIEPAFIDEEGRSIAIRQSAFSQVASAEATPSFCMVSLILRGGRVMRPKKTKQTQR